MDRFNISGNGPLDEGRFNEGKKNMSVLTKGLFSGKWIGHATSFTTADEALLSAAKVGDIVRLDGKRYRVTKKTNYNAAVEPYTFVDAIEDWFLEKADRYLS